MKKERTLSFQMSQKLTTDEIANVSASGTSVGTVQGTYDSRGGSDVIADVTLDM